MRRLSKLHLTGVMSGMLVLFLVGPTRSCGGDEEGHPWRYSLVDMPASLAVGAVRTPEFPVRHEAYFIMIQIEKPLLENPLPFAEINCMMGTTLGPLDVEDCRRINKEPLLQADWIVWEGDRIVARGSNPDHSAGMWTEKHIFKIFGPFMGETGKKYVVEMKFTKDGSPLNVANPHLIVISVKDH